MSLDLTQFEVELCRHGFKPATVRVYKWAVRNFIARMRSGKYDINDVLSTFTVKSQDVVRPAIRQWNRLGMNPVLPADGRNAVSAFTPQVFPVPVILALRELTQGGMSAKTIARTVWGNVERTDDRYVVGSRKTPLSHAGAFALWSWAKGNRASVESQSPLISQRRGEDIACSPGQIAARTRDRRSS